MIKNVRDKNGSKDLPRRYFVYTVSRQVRDSRKQLYNCRRWSGFTDLWKIPEQYQGAEVIDYGDKLIIPAFSDLHVHGAQYVQRGIGMDCLLSDWLNHYTFPQESRFQNMEYAKNCYDAFVDDMLRHGTFHANVLQPFTVRPQTISLIKWKRKVCMVMWER